MHKCCTASILIQRSTFRAIVWPKRESGITSLIIDDRAACRNLHRAAPTIHAFTMCMLPNQRGPFHTAKRAHVQSTSIGFSHCRGREYENPDSEWRGFYARCTTSQARARPFQSEYGRRIPFASHNPEAPKKKRKKEGVLRCF